ncbi:MAG: DUF1592 domain-containing protein [Acidobacteria bacterium]|nr:DUF1592 domain-containing protein [Acidobacteriota bacterium]
MHLLLLLLLTVPGHAQQPAAVPGLVASHCTACHNERVKQGGLDLTALPFDLKNANYFATWVKVHDRVQSGEMPPGAPASMTAGARRGFVTALAQSLMEAAKQRTLREGRSRWRRMNRYEYESTLRDVLHAPWLQIKEMLPEDGEAHRYNKIGEALDVSHVQMSRWMAAAEYALREVLPKTVNRPETVTRRYYAREQGSLARKIQFGNAPERNTFAVIGDRADVAVLRRQAPATVGAANPADREREGIGVIASTYEPLEIRFNNFVAKTAGRYKLRVNAHTFWIAPAKGPRWWKADPEVISAGRTHEPVTVYSEKPPRQMRRLGNFDVHPEASVNEIETYLLPGESIRPDAVRFFRSRPPGTWRNPLATEDGQPGVSFRWLEVEGPLVDEWPTPGYRLLFADLPLREDDKGRVEVVAKDAKSDARRLLRAFLTRVYRRPVPAEDVERFARLADQAMASGFSFTDAMISTYSAVLCAPAFVTLEEKPGALDSYALASRLSYFLWNSEPDAELRDLAARNRLRDPAVLRTQVARLLAHRKVESFVAAFLDYWLDLRKINNTAPDSTLYPDYYLDDHLVESAGDETRAFFTELLRGNLPARNLIGSDFAMLNERLARHYGLPDVTGVKFRRVALPADSPRGGLLTQASVLKVTANGTTTSPVLRGVWIVERILGQRVPPPPAAVPAVEPDTRGATTIRDQLAKHRTEPTCNACHAKIDPTGFALENFDVAGGWRDRYRALGEGQHAPGIGKGGHPFEFHYALQVDASGQLPDGRAFTDVRELKRLLLADERQIARTLVNQLVTYATGAPVGFADRPQVEAILDRTASKGYGVASLIEEIVQSEVFRWK